MGHYDFDTVIDRKNTDSFKWDMNGELFGNKDVISMWVADMDFACAPPIVEAVKKRAEHPVYGYTVRRKEFVQAVAGWLKKRHNCTVPEEWLAFAPPGVIFAIHTMLHIITEKGDKVAVQMPNYDPLFDLVKKTGRKLVECPIERNRDGEYNVNTDSFREIISREKPRVIITSSPHNPTGRVWTRDELKKMAEICLENDVFMIVDEIHADFVAKERNHVAFASLGEEIAKNSMVCYSANKGFNLGGLQMCSLIIADDEKRKAFNEQMSIMQTRLDTTFGEVATMTAYCDPECEQWLDEAIEYVEANKRFVSEYLKENCPRISALESEGTYFAWLNCEKLGLKGRELERFMLDEARVAFCAGYEFGEGGEEYLRMNLACPRSIVEKALRQITAAVNEK